MKKYEIVANSLLEKINTGVFPNGSFLPTEEQLTVTFGVSRQTVRKALSILEENSLIKKKQGSGSVIKRPNSGADSGNVAVIVTYIDDYIFPGQIRGIEETLSKNDLSALLFATKNQMCSERKILEDILNTPVAGILVEGTKTALSNPNIELYKKLINMNIPIVFFNGRYPELRNTLYVCADNRRGGEMLTEYLLNKNRKNIAAVFKADDIQGHERYAGYISAMYSSGLFVSDNKTIWYTTETKDLIFNESGNMLSAVNDSDAVICYNDEIAYMMIKHLTAQGKKVPDDIAVVSFDNSNLSEISPIKITSLSNDNMNIGAIAASKLVDVLNGKSTCSETIPWTLAEKESS